MVCDIYGETDLPQYDNGLGYMFVRCEGKTKYVHRLVWETFMGEIPKGYEVNHINEDKHDNRLDNLELLTHKQNCNYGTRNLRISKTKKERNNK